MKTYSPSLNQFFASEFEEDYRAAGSWPKDGVNVSDTVYDAMQAALADGKVIQPGPDGQPIAADAPLAPAVPRSVSPAQARLALLASGLLDDVEAAVQAGDRATQIAWGMATAIERNSPTVAALAGALGLTDGQLDDLFTAAAAIRV